MTANGKIPVYTVYSSAGHPALALGMITAYARHHKAGALADTYEFVPGALRTPEQARAALDTYGPGVVLSSNYIWSHHRNMRLARLMSQWEPECVLVCGGPSVPKYERTCHAFLENCPEVDITVRGEGEVATAELLEQLAGHWTSRHDRGCLSTVAGISYRPSPRCPADMVQRTDDRPRVVDIDTLPSPYLTGRFDGEDFSQWHSAIIETNRGCPYGCTFCDWGAATNSKVRKFELDRVRAEIEWIARHQIGGLWIADANFGIFQRDVEIAEMIVACRREYGYPRRVIVNYAKHSSDRLAEIVGLLRTAGVMADGIISIQTQDPETLVNVRRQNIKTDHYDKLIRAFRQRQLRVSSDLMIGLPGATVTSYKADLQFFFDRGVFAKCYATVLLPNSPMADPEYMQRYDIKVDARGYLQSCYSYTPDDLAVMRDLYVFYKMLVGYGILKRVLYYLQYDHRIPALTVIDDLRRCVKEQPERLPTITPLMQELLAAKDNLRRPMWRRTAHEWEEIFREIERFVETEYGVSNPSLRAMLAIQAKLLPCRGRVLPERIEVPYDVAAYFQTLQDAWGAPADAVSSSDWAPLDSYGPGTLDISDPHGFCAMTEEEIPFEEGHHLDWELASPLALTIASPVTGTDEPLTPSATT